MRRFLMSAAVISLAWAGLVGAQMKVTTPEDHDKAMKALGGAFGGVAKALGSGATADAKTGLNSMRMTLVGVQGFWEARKKDKQVGYAKEAISSVDAAIKAIDGGGDVGASVKMVGAACGGCHKESRDPDPANEKSFVIKPELLK